MREAAANTLVMVLAGGQGERLYPLTRDRAKPAVPFAGSYRLIDFTLSNCLNSGLRRVLVLTQYKSDSLNRHVRLGWSIFNREIGEYIDILPPQQRMSSDWYLGTAHAIYQNIYLLEHERPTNVLVLSGDHVYRMDYMSMLERHVANDADVTVACRQEPVESAAGALGVVATDEDLRATAFEEKPAQPRTVVGRDDVCLCSMGVYVFKTEALVRRVIYDAKRGSTHDFGRDVLPSMVEQGDRVFAYPFEGRYWRDVGTIDAYWHAHMELIGVQPVFNLYDRDWPVRGLPHSRPPAKTVFGGGPDGAPRTEISNSLISNGAIISGACVRDSVIGPDVHIEVGSRIERSIIFDGVRIGRNVTIQKAVIDKRNVIPDNARIGVDHAWDSRHFSVSQEGVVVMPKSIPFPPF